ncbi:hypothetical protein P7K49_025633, partial [Saguinus oedipus]
LPPELRPPNARQFSPHPPILQACFIPVPPPQEPLFLDHAALTTRSLACYALTGSLPPG